MKNFGSLLLGIIIGAVVMYIYFSKDNLEMKDDCEITAPKGLISPSEASVLDKAYNIKHNIVNDSLFKKSPDGGDNRSSWWSITEIENYICYAKNQANEGGYVLDGLRLYLGSYPNTKEQAGLTTMFFIPTGYKNESESSMFFLKQSGRDLKNSDGLNIGNSGHPPSSSYPQ